MSLQTKTIGRMPTDHGPYDPELAYGKKFQCTLFGCAWESLHDNNNTAPAVWDGGDTITPNLVDWKKVSGSYEAWLMNHDKPATSEQYPFNGMGRVRLQKNIVDGVNTLTQAMLTQQNTIYVIQYDFTLGEDITVPANCVLEFDGGSVSGTYTLTGNNTGIKAELVKIFGVNIVFAGTFISDVNVEWFGLVYDNVNIDNSPSFTKASELSQFTNSKIIRVSGGIIYLNVVKSVNPGGSWEGNFRLYSGNTLIMSNDTYLKAIPNSSRVYSMIYAKHASNIVIKGGNLVGDVEGHTGQTTSSEWGYGIALIHCKNCLIEDINVSNCWGDGIIIEAEDDQSASEGREDRLNKNIKINNVVLKNNRRNNISFGGVNGLLLSNSVITGAGSINGTAPKCGIDIESDTVGKVFNKNIIIENCNCFDNVGFPLNFEPSLNPTTNKYNIDSVTVSKCSFDGTVKVTGDNISIKNNKSIAGFYVVDVNNCYIDSNIVTNGPIRIFDNRITVQDVYFQNNIICFEQQSYLQEINTESNTLHINNNTYKFTVAPSNVWIYNYKSKLHILKNCVFVNNTGTDVISNQSNSKILFEDCKFVDCPEPYGLCVNDGVLTSRLYNSATGSLKISLQASESFKFRFGNTNSFCDIDKTGIITYKDFNYPTNGYVSFPYHVSYNDGIVDIIVSATTRAYAIQLLFTLSLCGANVIDYSMVENVDYVINTVLKDCMLPSPGTSRKDCPVDANTRIYVKNNNTQFVFNKDFVLVDNETIVVNTSSELPTFLDSNYAGAKGYVKDTKKSVSYDGTEWVDATGTPV